MVKVRKELVKVRGRKKMVKKMGVSRKRGRWKEGSGGGREVKGSGMVMR